MRIADITPGQIVRYGKRKDLENPELDRDGKRIKTSCPALVLAIGPYTMTRVGHCGDRHPALMSSGPKRVVILRQRDENEYHSWGGASYKEIDSETLWFFDVVTPTNLMGMEEWDLKTFGLFEMQAEIDVWKGRYKAAKKAVYDEAKARLTGVLPIPKGQHFSMSLNAVHPHPTEKNPKPDLEYELTVEFKFNEKQLRKLVESAKVTYLHKLRKTRPDACAL